MDIKRQLEGELSNQAQREKCPDRIYFKVRNSYIESVMKKGENIKMKKTNKFVLNGIALAVAIMIPVGALAAPYVIKAFNTIKIEENGVNMTLSEYLPEKTNLTDIQQAGLETAYKAYPELEKFEISTINSGEGNVDSEIMDWCSITLKDGNRKFTLDIDNVTGDFHYLARTNWGVDYSSLSEDELVGESLAMIESVYGKLDGYDYEFKSAYEDLNTEKAELVKDNDDYKNRKYLEISNEDEDRYFKVDYSEKGQLAVVVLNK